MDLTKNILTAKEAREVADNFDYLFSDIMNHIKDCAGKNEHVLIYMLQKLYISDVALTNAIEQLEKLGYKIDKQYSSYEIRVEW